MIGVGARARPPTAAAPAPTGTARWRSGAPARKSRAKPIAPSSAGAAQVGLQQDEPARAADDASGGSRPRTKPSSAGGRRFSHHARNTTVARRAMSVGWSVSVPEPEPALRAVRRRAPPTATHREQHRPRRRAASGASASSRRRSSARARAASTATPSAGAHQLALQEVVGILVARDPEDRARRVDHDTPTAVRASGSTSSQRSPRFTPRASSRFRRSTSALKRRPRSS